NTINYALESDDPLSIVPSQDTIGHGTMLAGLCAGSPNEAYGFSGIATEAEFIIVKLKEAKPYLRSFFEIPPSAICYQENDVIMAIKYLDSIATSLDKPLVICIGIGTSQSDHTGNRIVTRYLSSLATKFGRGIVTSGGNEANRASHYYGDIMPSSTYDHVILNVGAEEPGFAMQFWGTSPNRFWIDIYTPSGEFLSRVPPISGKTIIPFHENTILIIDSQIKGLSTNEQFIIMRFHYPMAGQWNFYVYGETGDLPMQFHIWLPIHNFISSNTNFSNPSNYTTITVPGNSANIITTTGYDPSDQTLYHYASKGFTVLNYPKPDIAAPGVNILCPSLNNTFAYGTGTSLSAAYTCGILAILLEWSIANNNLPQMNNLLLKKIVTESAVRTPKNHYPNPDWGYGMLNMKRMKKTISEFLDTT
ncbi:MAG: S8 family peptidase, partial [Anaerocolumna sp.]